MAFQWVSADLLTGRLIADLPSFDPQWPLRRTISQADTATGTLHLDGAPENWERAIREAAAMLACYDDAIRSRPIVWCGYVPGLAGDGLDTASDDVPVALATYEAVLDRAYVGDATYTTAQHRDDIIASLINDWWAPNIGITYLRLAYTPGGGPTPAEDIVMNNADNATVLTRIQQVIAQLGGEFTVDWAWSDDKQSLVPTLRFGDRIGRPAPTAPDGSQLQPAVTFSAPGQLLTLKQGRSYAAGDGANVVVPYSSGQGSTTPFGEPVTGPPDGRPRFEYRYQPAPNLSPAALSQYAQQASKILAPGKRPISLVAARGRMMGRQLGVDWTLGDDIGYEVRSPYTGVDGATITIRAFPTGLSGIGRAIAYEFTDTTVTPILADAQIYTDQGS